MDPLSLGDRSFVEENFEAAVQHYSEAIKLDPSAARAYEARAKAYIELEGYTEAAEDAAKAIELDPNNFKAFLRKGVACFYLEEYETSKESFEMGLQLAPENNELKKWIRKCQAELAEEEVAVVAKPAAAPVPPVPPPASPPPAVVPTPAPLVTSAPSVSESAPAPVIESAKPLAPSAPPPQEGTYRYQWYQVGDKVTLDVYAKNLKREQVLHEFTDTTLHLQLLNEDGQCIYELKFELANRIVPAGCKCEVLKTKVEVCMKKEQALHWATLDRDKKLAASGVTSSAAGSVPTGYPTSYKKNPKDWDQVENELSELEKKGELDFGDPLNNFFKKIYGQGDEDQRRAMMKSFVESGGTVLSTNWQEVGTKKVECTPPDGMEVKKWEQ